VVESRRAGTRPPANICDASRVELTPLVRTGNEMSADARGYWHAGGVRCNESERFSARFETRSDGWQVLCGVKRARAMQVIWFERVSQSVQMGGVGLCGVKRARAMQVIFSSRWGWG